jgi:glycosyltransferase involved in cell wall biosynthesis
MSISAFLPVFNEESRIETTLKTLQWCNEIIVLDKESKDSTRQLSESLGARVFTMKNSSAYDASEFDYLLNECKSEWVLLFTASDLIHPKLALEIKRLTSMSDFPYDVIYVPFRRYVLGIETNRSPWYSENAPMVIRKRVVKINKHGVHNALHFDTKRYYKIKNSNEFCMYHLTHTTVDGMMDRHLRYWRGETLASNEQDVKKAFLSVVKSFFIVGVKRMSFLLGWKGVMLGFAYISYFMMAFVYKWERKYSQASSTYDAIKSKVLTDWDNAPPVKEGIN